MNLHTVDASAGQPPLAPPSEAAIRDELERLALLDLLGPRHGPEEELVGQRPRNRYLVGTLAPQKYRVRPEELDAVGTAGGEHDPSSGSATLHGAACHACQFVPETSCERANRYLDRAALVPIFGREQAGFFAGLLED